MPIGVAKVTIPRVASTEQMKPTSAAEKGMNIHISRQESPRELRESARRRKNSPAIITVIISAALMAGSRIPEMKTNAHIRKRDKIPESLRPFSFERREAIIPARRVMCRPETEVRWEREHILNARVM